MKKLLENFVDPKNSYRGKPFWAWNGKLEETELRRQIRIFHQMGLGGFFMHSRVGLETPYLSKEWFRMVDACIDEAAQHGMEAWLYDEDRWPSGAAGGLVTRDPRYRAHYLAMEQSKIFTRSSDIIAVFTGKIEGQTISDLCRIPTKSRKPLKKGYTFLVFRDRPQEPNPWYNGQTYLDTLNPAAVRKFIQTTHQAYARHCGKSFGKVIPGIFTDEPNYYYVPNRKHAAITRGWTTRLPIVFKKRYGYDLLDHLPELFFHVDGKTFSRVRRDYYDCMTHLFVEAFSVQISQWCEQHHLLHTGHVLLEQPMASQTECVGSAMRFLQHMQAPGMDLLTEHRREYETAKQVTSVARQFGRKWRLTETYGCTGWDFSFAGHKALGDWQAAMGINLRCQHLSYYTMEGEAKRDYPASISYQSPWWEHYRTVEDYFARIHLVMTRGREVRDVLLIHPIESTWARFIPEDHEHPHIRSLERSLIEVRDTLLANNIDFDYGDEDIMANHGRVGRRNGEPTLIVGQAPYRVVVVPPMLTIRNSTLKLLEAFERAGGHVVFAGSPPANVDVQRSPLAHRLAKRCIQTARKGDPLVSAVEKRGRRISILDADSNQTDSTLYLLREDASAYYCFICNTGHASKSLKPHIVDATMVRDRRKALPHVRMVGFEGCQGSPLELDPQTGEKFLARANRKDDRWEIQTDLPPLGSRLFIVPKKKSSTTGFKTRPVSSRIMRRNELSDEAWNYTLSEPNVLVLDAPRHRIGKGAWRDPEDILFVDRKARKAIGIPPRGSRMVQPWARPPQKQSRSVPTELVYQFNVRAIPSGELWLGLEQPERYHVTLNGTSLTMDADAGWWVDHSLHRIPIDPALLRKGDNELSLECLYDASHPGFENIYLLGMFGVWLKGSKPRIGRLPEKLQIGDWTTQGLPFYSGSLTYRRNIRINKKPGRHIVVCIPEYRGVGVRVLVDGQPAGLIGWEPNEVDITDAINNSTLEIGIEILGHRRNSHGPLHHSEKWPEWTGPLQFITEGKDRIPGFQVVPCGLMASPYLEIRKLGVEKADREST